jgi:hypothetical protein
MRAACIGISNVGLEVAPMKSCCVRIVSWRRRIACLPFAIVFPLVRWVAGLPPVGMLFDW